MNRVEAAQFSKLFRDYVLPVAPGKTLTRTLTLSSDSASSESGGQVLVPILQSNQAYAQLILKMSLLQERIASWEAEEKGKPDLERILLERTVGLLGRNATRNTICSVRLNRASETGLPRKESDKMFLSPQDQIRLALKAEDICQDGNMAFSDQAFAAGLHYDWLVALIAAKKAPADVKKFLETTWTEALRTARVAYDLVSQVKAFKYDRYAYGAGLLLPIGKILMAIAYPKDLGDKSYAAFLSECDKNKKAKHTLFLLTEKRRFPITHNAFSALFVSAFSFFRPVEKAIHFYVEPGYLRSHDRDLYLLATLLSTAATLASAASPDPKSLNLIQRKGLSELKIPDKALENAIGRLKKGKG